jgi:hypothetical protein
MISRTKELNPVATFKEVLTEERHNRKVFYNSKGVQIAVVDFYYKDAEDFLPYQINVSYPTENGVTETLEKVYDYFLLIRRLYRESENPSLVQTIINFVRNLFRR